jgi:hypothetical protein
MRQGIVGVIVLLLGSRLAHAQVPTATESTSSTPAIESQPAESQASNAFYSSELNHDDSCPADSDCPPTSDLEMGGKASHQNNKVRIWDCELPPMHLLAGVEALYWHVRPMPDVPLFTTGPGFIVGSGALGQANTNVIAGPFDTNLEPGYQVGYRFRLGAAVEHNDSLFGIEVSYFRLEESTTQEGPITAPTGLSLSRPVINARNNQETVLAVTAKDQFVGSGAIFSATRFMGADTVLSFTPDGRSYSFIAGFTYLNLDERLNVNQDTSLLAQGLVGLDGATVNPPATVLLRDTIQTRNQFYGGHLGFRVETDYCHPLYAQFMGRVSVGTTDEEVMINGSSTYLRTGAAPTTRSGGLLALSSNIGSNSQMHMAVVPEFAVNLGFEFGAFRIFAGYQFLYWSNVVRPTTEVDRTINPSFLPTSIAFGGTPNPNRPTAPFRQDDVIIQGISLGLEICY